jgi:phage-related protein
VKLHVHIHNHSDDHKFHLINQKLDNIMSAFTDLQGTLDGINTSLTTIQNNQANGLTADQTAQIASALQSVATILANIANPPAPQP